MDFSLSEDQTIIRDSFRRCLDLVSPLDKARKISADPEPADNDVWQALVGLGMPGLIIPEEFGGTALTLLEAVLVAEELGRSVAPVPFAASVIMAPLALITAASPAQKRELLPKIASGDFRIGVAISDAASGRRNGPGIVARDDGLTGQARAVLDAGNADAYIIADNAGVLHLLEATSDGIDVEDVPTIDGTRHTAHLNLRSVASEPLVHGDGTELRSIIDAGRVVLAADSLGAGEEMLRQAVDYSLQRRQFDRQIGSFQAVKHMCAEMAANLQPCRALLWYAAYAFDALPQAATSSAIHAKSEIDEVGRFVARTATEVHGGMGFTDLLGLHYWFKRIGYNRAHLGGPEVLRAEQTALLLQQNT